MSYTLKLTFQMEEKKIEIKINKVVDTVLEMSQLMGVDYKTIWDNYMHELITSQFTWEEVEDEISARSM